MKWTNCEEKKEQIAAKEEQEFLEKHNGCIPRFALWPTKLNTKTKSGCHVVVWLEWYWIKTHYKSVMLSRWCEHYGYYHCYLNHKEAE